MLLRFKALQYFYFLLLLLSLLGFHFVSLAETVYVPQDYQSIQEAIQTRQDQDQVIVAPGYYRENLQLEGQNVILRSTNPNDAVIVSRTIVDGGGIDSVITLDGTEPPSCQIVGLTLTNGRNKVGAGILGNGSKATIALNRIVGNRAISIDETSAHGAGLAQCHGQIIGNTILENQVDARLASGSGGGIYQANGTILNNVIARNRVAVLWEASGGGLSSCQAEIINNTIVYNHTVSLSALAGYAHGGGVSNCSGVIQNCILWANESMVFPQIYNSSQPTYSCLPNGTIAYHNIAMDPLLLAVAENDFRLAEGSPCIDRGGELNAPSTDLTNFRRSSTDIGAYEWRAVPVVTTLPGESTEDGQIWFHGHLDSKIEVSAGTAPPGKYFFEYGESLAYGSTTPVQDLLPDQTTIKYLATDLRPNATYHFRLVATYERGRSYGQDQILILGQPIVKVPDDYRSIQAAIDAVRNGYQIIVSDGTYAGNLNLRGKAILLRSANGAENCILDSRENGRGIVCQTGETTETIIDGFTIINGRADGGGIACLEASPTIRNCLLVDNMAGQFGYGGGLYCRNANPVLENCVIRQNRGGGIYCLNSSPKITGCLIENNTTISSGGGIYCQASSPEIQQTIIRHNRADYYGGGLHCRDAQPELVNCILDHNSAIKGGAIGAEFYASPLLINCTIVSNQVYYQSQKPPIKQASGAIYAQQTASPRLVNSILWLNGENPIEYHGDILQIRYSAVEGGFPNLGNIDTDPVFADIEQYEYYVSDQSDCIGGGTPDLAPAFDFEGNSRGQTPTIGAYEIGRYIAAEHVIKTVVDLGGVIEPAGDISALRMSDQPFQILVQTGHLLTDVLINGESIGPVTDYNFQRIKSNHTIEAKFISYPVAFQIRTVPQTYQGEAIEIELALLNVRQEPIVPLSPITVDLSLEGGTGQFFTSANYQKQSPITEITIPTDQTSTTVFFRTHQLGQTRIDIRHRQSTNDSALSATLSNSSSTSNLVNPEVASATHDLTVITALDEIKVSGSPIDIGQTATITLIGKSADTDSFDAATATFSIPGLVESQEAYASAEDPTRYIGYFTPILDQHLKGVYDLTGTIGHSQKTLKDAIRLVTTPQLSIPTVNKDELDETADTGQSIVARNGDEIYLSISANRSGLVIMADVSEVDTTQTEPIQLEHILDSSHRPISIDENASSTVLPDPQSAQEPTEGDDQELLALDSTESERITDPEVYAITHEISYQNTATDGTKVIRFTATDPHGDIATPLKVSIDLKNTISFTLDVPEDVSLIYLPLAVKRVNGQERSIDRISDLYRALGGNQTVKFLVTYQPETGDWVSYFGRYPASFRADVPISNVTGIISVMRQAVTLNLEGHPLDHRLELQTGLNMIGLPRQDPRLVEVGDLLQLDSVGESITHLIVQSNQVDPADQLKGKNYRRFLAVAFPNADGTITLARQEPVTAGRGIVVMTKSTGTVVTKGNPWPTKLDPVSLTTPIAAPSTIAIPSAIDLLVLHGSVDADLGQTPIQIRVTSQSDAIRDDNSRFRLRRSSQWEERFELKKALDSSGTLNSPDQTSQTLARTSVDKADATRPHERSLRGQYSFALTLVGLSTDADYKPTQVGDVLEISVQYADLTAFMIKHTVTATETLNRYIDLGQLRPVEAPPSKTHLFANYPNPFNPETWIPYDLAAPTQTEIKIYNVNGALVRKIEMGHQTAGSYTYHWDGRTENGELTASGIYFYTLKTDDFESTRKMVILK